MNIESFTGRMSRRDIYHRDGKSSRQHCTRSRAHIGRGLTETYHLAPWFILNEFYGFVAEFVK
jgi:hypothetical protein